MNELETTNKRLIEALTAIIGSSDKEELRFMEQFIRGQNLPEQEKTAMCNGINLLLELL